MPYGNLLADVVQGSTANTAPVFKDGNGTTIGTLCRAWVNFNGTGTVAIIASFNVSSITDNGTGAYTVNFTNAMPDTNYAIAGSVRFGTISSFQVLTPSGPLNGSRTINAAPVQTGNGNTPADCQEVTVAIFR